MKTNKATEKAKPQMTSAHIPRAAWFLLRKVALQRSLKQGVPVSLGDVVAALVEKHQKELERELD